MEDPQNVKITLLLIKGKYNVPKYGMDTVGSEYSRMIGCVAKTETSLEQSLLGSTSACLRSAMTL